MKKSIFLLSIITTLTLTSCGTKNHYKLHPRVGEKLEDGVIFYVSDDESYALVCAYTDLQVERSKGRNNYFAWDLGTYRWSTFDRDTLLQQDSVWTVISPTDSTFSGKIDSNWFYGFIGAISEDNGIENTNKLLDPSNYPTKPLFANIAAKECHDYYYGIYSYRKSEQTSSPWMVNKGQWYLPSIQELRYLAYAKDKINSMKEKDSLFYPAGRATAEDAGKMYRYGWESLMYCYWSSTERNAQNAYYKCVDGENQAESYVPKNGQRTLLSIRPVRKVLL
jgi:hypothetical protein